MTQDGNRLALRSWLGLDALLDGRPVGAFYNSRSYLHHHKERLTGTRPIFHLADLRIRVNGGRGRGMIRSRVITNHGRDETIMCSSRAPTSCPNEKSFVEASNSVFGLKWDTCLFQVVSSTARRLRFPEDSTYEDISLREPHEDALVFLRPPGSKEDHPPGKSSRLQIRGTTMFGGDKTKCLAWREHWPVDELGYQGFTRVSTDLGKKE
ncbi:hypothetical protein C8Q74DRAFT_1222212 [Fomes fomentarius]|nr:hypothetical protein C8Q74DRAFT_1222212 [Fomes fomentarius]